MGIADTLAGLIFRSPPTRAEPRDPRRSKELPVGGPPCEARTSTWPRATWNDHVGGVVSQRQTWQVIGILSL